MPGSDGKEQQSRWAVSRLEGVVWAALAAFAVLSAVLGWGYIFDVASGPVQPPVATPVWPAVVLFGIGAFLVKHLRNPAAANSTDEEVETVPFFARK